MLEYPIISGMKSQTGRRDEASGHTEGWKAGSVTHSHTLTSTIKGKAGVGEDAPKRYPFKRNVNPARAAWEIILAFHLRDLAKEKAPVLAIITIETNKTEASTAS